MKRLFFPWACLASIVFFASPHTVFGSWVLDWSEECDGDYIQTESVYPQVGWRGYMSGELQYYTDRPKNFRVEDGECIFTAHDEPYADKQYTSARITTKGKRTWTYGAFEARLSWPYGQGFFPAAWLDGNPDGVGWPSKGEIDIFEARGQRPDEAFSTLRGPHKGGREGVVTKTTTFLREQLAERMHVYRVEWFPDEIRFLVDGEVTSRWNPESYPGEWVFHHPMYFTVNLAIGTGLVGPPDETTFFPSSLYLDYMRVYRWED